MQDKKRKREEKADKETAKALKKEEKRRLKGEEKVSHCKPIPTKTTKATTRPPTHSHIVPVSLPIYLLQAKKKAEKKAAQEKERLEKKAKEKEKQLKKEEKKSKKNKEKEAKKKDKKNKDKKRMAEEQPLLEKAEEEEKEEESSSSDEEEDEKKNKEVKFKASKKQKITNTDNEEEEEYVYEEEEARGGGAGTAAKAFQRVKAEEWLGKKGSWDNSYVGTFGASGWGFKAQQILGKVRGKDFRHEKTKKKRGSYKGGEINTQAVCSFKFDSDAE
jgi:hypothetical protein